MRSLVLVLALLLGACDRNGDVPNVNVPDIEAPDLTAGLKDLCRGIASTAARADQEGAFFDRAHDSIHRLAERVKEKRPDLAADLLEAKQRVESNLQDAKKKVPRAAFRDLARATDRALEAVDAPRIGCR